MVAFTFYFPSYIADERQKYRKETDIDIQMEIDRQRGRDDRQRVIVTIEVYPEPKTTILKDVHGRFSDFPSGGQDL